MLLKGPMVAVAAPVLSSGSIAGDGNTAQKPLSNQHNPEWFLDNTPLFAMFTSRPPFTFPLPGVRVHQPIARTSLLVLTTLFLLDFSSAALSVTRSESQEFERVRKGEEAIRFAAGKIVHSMPRDGAVSAITGDNQTTGNRRMIGSNEVMYLTLKNPQDTKPGDLYTVYRLVRRVFHPSDRRDLGTLFIMAGVVEVVEAGTNPVTVKVAESYHSIYPGDPAMRFEPLPAPERPSPREPIEGTGMIVELPQDRTMIGENQVVYIDWGRKDGIRSGDRLEVFRDSVGLPRRVIGELKVLGVEETTSTAMVVNSDYQQFRGDRFSFKGVGKAAAPAVVTEFEFDKKPEAEEPEPTEATAGTPAVEDEERILLEGLLDHIEFDSGEIVIKKEGEEVLSKLSDVLKGESDKFIRVEGHTDNMDIGPTLSQEYPSNWELSAARANKVMQYLVETGKIKPTNVSAVGYADTRPVADNASEPGRQKNRRVEIVVYSSDPSLPKSGESTGAAEEPLPETSVPGENGVGNDSAPTEEAPLPLEEPSIGQDLDLESIPELLPPSAGDPIS